MAKNQNGLLLKIAPFLEPIVKSKDLTIVFFIISILAIIIVPLPSAILDFFLVISLSVAVLVILISQKNAPQDVDTLSNQLGISKSFLAKILQSLAKENILTSFKGAHGGFMLAHKPDALTLKRIVECAEKKQTMVFECQFIGYQYHS